jgi:hypothetical protein
MINYRVMLFSLSVSSMAFSGLSQAQQQVPAAPAKASLPAAEVRVDISTTISGNQQQPRTLYVLPWQDSIAQIRIAAPGITVPADTIQPLDRQQFLRFIEAQTLSRLPASTASIDQN